MRAVDERADGLHADVESDDEHRHDDEGRDRGEREPKRRIDEGAAVRHAGWLYGQRFQQRRSADAATA